MSMVEYITDEGKEMLAQMLAGRVKITFTKIQMGDGVLQIGQSKKTMTELVHLVKEIEVYRTRVSDENVVSIMGIFVNSEMSSGFFFREKGIFASDGTKEILFSYANAGDSAEYINPPTVESIEKQIISLCTSLQDTESNINITVESGIYALYNDLEEMKTELDDKLNKEIAGVMKELEDDVQAINEAIGKKANEREFTSHVNDSSNPHGVTKSQVGLGNVPNVATNDQTPTYTAASANANLTSGEKLSVAFGKIAKAISSLISHLANKSNPHGVTASQIGAMSSTNPTGTGSFSMGRKADTTIGTNSHSEGDNTTASGNFSHAEGSGTTASGGFSHAEGSGTTASGGSSHAEGSGTTASGGSSHAGGSRTIAAGDYQTAIGKYNIEDKTSAFIVGNGTSTKRSNAMTVDWDGNLKTAGDITNGNGVSLDTLNSNFDSFKNFITSSIGQQSEPILDRINNSMSNFGTFGAVYASDAPTEGEWCILWFGSGGRIKVIASAFAGTDMYERSLFNSNWYNSWTKLH